MEQNNKEESKQVNNPLHGVRLIDMLEYLVKEYGWNSLGAKINIRSFNNNPSMNSSLKFLRKTDWARKKVEDLYIRTKEREEFK
ncbi:VF530 family protein [Belliella sp. R4-6]|uniref:VF530 family protein n=1 Tax=Belliella alkalica TaxID=1730871 RepID=A0ABS9VF04_9BACT|nr:VF530 family protein [Belliella alkalica]MCH7415021.1 VF530 family protein [Belliella alkalica]